MRTPDDSQRGIEAMNGWDEHALKLVDKAIVEAGCEIMYERIAEAFEPEYKAMIARMFIRMRDMANRPLKPAKPEPRNSIDRRLQRLRGGC